jgi:ligand-binding sensor protein
MNTEHKCKNILTDFAMGLIIGFIVAVVICGCIFGVIYSKQKNKEKIEYAERQQAIEQLVEDYSNTDPYEFIDTVPGVSGAADGAAADFIRKRDEALQRFRNRLAD